MFSGYKSDRNVKNTLMRMRLEIRTLKAAVGRQHAPQYWFSLFTLGAHSLNHYADSSVWRGSDLPCTDDEPFQHSVLRKDFLAHDFDRGCFEEMALAVRSINRDL